MTSRQLLNRTISERQLQQTIVEAATVTGCWLVYHTYDSRRSHAGWPDPVLLGKPGSRAEGWAMFLELKDRRRQPTPEQRFWLSGLQAALSGDKVVVALVRPAHLDWILALIQDGPIRAPQPTAVPDLPRGVEGERPDSRRLNVASRRRRPHPAAQNRHQPGEQSAGTADADQPNLAVAAREGAAP